MTISPVYSCQPAQISTGDGGCGDHTHAPTVNGPLDILDLGCGTGLAGAWLKDYAKTLIGVDISTEMVKAAKKKQVKCLFATLPFYFDVLCSFVLLRAVAVFKKKCLLLFSLIQPRDHVSHPS